MESQNKSCDSTHNAGLEEIKDNGTEQDAQIISGDPGDIQDVSFLVAKDDTPGTEDDDLLMDDTNDKQEIADTPDELEAMEILGSNPDNKASKESLVQNSSSKTEGTCNIDTGTLKNTQEDLNAASSPAILTNKELSKISNQQTAVSRLSKTSSETVVLTSKKDVSQSKEPRDESIVVQLTDSLQNEIDSDLLDLPKNADKNSTKTFQPAVTANSKEDDVKKESSIEASSVTSNRNAGKKDAAINETSKDGKSAVTSSPTKIAKKDTKTPPISRNLWVSGLSSNTKAADLKTLFSKHGKVIGAKVVTNARNPGSKCYGFVTMGTPGEATACVQHVNRTEFHGRMISVERAKTEPQGGKTAPKTSSGAAKSSAKPIGSPAVTKNENKLATSKTLTGKNVVREKEAKKPVEKEKGFNSGRKKPDEVVHTGRSRERPNEPVREMKQRDSLSFAKIKAARERTRLRTKQKFLRIEERRLRFGLQQKHYHQQFLEERQREEKMKLDREKRKLREMKDQLERERMETERLKLETERLRIQKEQESYRREQQRVLQESRPLKRSIDHGRREDEWARKKRLTTSERFPPARRQQAKPERKPERYERRESEQVARYDSYREERPNRRESFRYEELERNKTQREYKSRDERRVVYREDRSLESRSQREDRGSARESTRGQPKIDSRSEWKIEREPTRVSKSAAWNGPVEYKTQSGWTQSGSNMSTSRQTGTWHSGGVVMSQPGTSYAMQPGAVMASNMGATPIIIAQPGAMQGTPVILQGNISRHGDGHYNLSSGTVRRY